MKYFFVLGKNQALSAAELGAVFGMENLVVVNNVAFLESNEELNAEEVISGLGGTVKMGVIRDNHRAGDKKQTADKAVDIILSRAENATGKFKFGFSQYHKKPLIDPKKTGMDAKRALKEKGVNSRMVTSREKTLSSVVVEQNKLTEKGVEVVFFKQGEEVLTGETQAVQPFKQLSYRDYGRPERDDHSGMLPPKLAQTMINLATGNKNKDRTLLDPFCGSGTILTEALLKGFTNLIGTDTSSKAVADTEKNINWIKDKYHLNAPSLHLYQQDATSISSVLSPRSVDAIVTEPYLGPQRGKFDLDGTVSYLEDLYTRSLQEFQKILQKHAYVVIIFPVFNIGNKNPRLIYPDLAGYETVNMLPNAAPIQDRLTSRNTFIYGREGQKIWREVLILRKK